MNTIELLELATKELKESNDAYDEYQEKVSYTKRQLAGETLSDVERERYIFLIKKHANEEYEYNKSHGWSNE